MHISPQTAFFHCNDRIQTHFIIISVDMHQPATDSVKYTNTQKASTATFSLHSCAFSKKKKKLKPAGDYVPPLV